MRKLSLILVFLLSSVFLISGCQEKPHLPQKPTQPRGFIELVQAYKDGKLFEEAVRQPDSYVLKFADGYKLTIADSDIRIHDCTSRKPAKVEVSSSWWTIDGVTIPVKADSSVFLLYIVYFFHSRSPLFL